MHDLLDDLLSEFLRSDATVDSLCDGLSTVVGRHIDSLDQQTWREVCESIRLASLVEVPATLIGRAPWPDTGMWAQACNVVAAAYWAPDDA